MKKNILLTLTLFFLACHFTIAQGWQWAKCGTGTYSEGFGCLAATDGQNNVCILQGYGGDVMIGNDSFNVQSKSQMIVAKYGPSGNLLWANNITCSSQNGGMLPCNICTDGMGNVYVSGLFTDDILMGSYHLIADSGAVYSPFFAKYDNNGSLLWSHTIGSHYTGNSLQNISMSVLQDGSIYLMGNFLAPSATIGGILVPNNGSNASITGYNTFVARYSTDGNIVWVKNMGSGGLLIKAQSDGNMYVLGIADRSFSFGGIPITAPISQQTTFIAKCDTSANVLWAKTLNSTRIYGDLLVTDAYDNFFVAGSFIDTIVVASDTLINTSTISNGTFISKYDSSGKAIWGRSITQPANDLSPKLSDQIVCWNLATDKCGNIWATGSMDSSAAVGGKILTKPANSFDPVYLIKFSPWGELLADATLQSGGYFWKVGLATDNNSNAFLTASYGLPHPPFVVGADTMYSNWPNTQGNFLAKFQMPDAGTEPASFPDTMICHGLPILLNLSVNIYPGATALWSDGSTASTFVVKDTGIYWVTVNNGLCITSDTAKVSSEFCDCKIFLPNAFTPNNDGKNDKYFPIIQPGCPVSNFKFVIYNRWGQCVFQSNDPLRAWNGTYMGVDAEIGTYEYMLEFNIRPLALIETTI